MALTDNGRDFLAQACIADASPAYFNNANARLGVGDSATAFDKAQTDLQAATNKVRVGMDGSYPQRTANAITFRSTFADGVAQWVWNEWGTFNAASGPTMLNRSVSSMGTKAAGSSWVLTVTVTLTD
jgi:hypothetical protein